MVRIRTMKTLRTLLIVAGFCQLFTTAAQAQTVDTMPPVVVKAVPEAGSKEIAAGVVEIRVRVAGAYRLMYVAKFPEAVYVLHAFQKKTRKTALADLELAKDRYREVLIRRKLL